ncbi:papain like cysteine protease AvrRpt2 [Mycobacterium sp. BK086]|uniref:papain-like cysteine protease family protein n=1 Tax=Mycobacterium sp. BK086 TaxID=2512165 RepID=UPI0010F092F8|nr:papain-like cysteine protease family protein [Mycobacterium sp. BK086]TDO06481.1 papain like cysteine protease AvrRpt2 [Mycobacterium sp. BK086]
MACEAEQAALTEANDRLAEARDGCAAGVRGWCQQVNRLLHEQARATAALDNCRFWRLPFVMQPQEQSNWCWAAVAVSVANYYDGTSRSQCSFVNTFLGRDDCCPGPTAPSPCNVAEDIQPALEATGRWQGKKDGPVSAADLAVIRDRPVGRPLVVEIHWKSSRPPRLQNHFLAIIGHRVRDNMVAVADPAYGPSDLPLNELNTNYKSDGIVTQVHFTT